jgi:uncharacterized membrane protein
VIADRQVERTISLLLRVGVLLAALVVFAGGVRYLIYRGGALPAYHTFHGEPAGLRAPALVLHGAFSGQAEAIIQLGLLVLIVTPVARVAFSVVAFALERDFEYFILTLIVLAVLLYSLLAA